MIKNALKTAIRATGYELRRAGTGQFIMPVEFSKSDVEIVQHVIGEKLTMVGPARVVATVNACKHSVLSEVAGDFVECGVWRGGNSIAAKLTFENYGSDKKVYLFDTFAGMTAPGEEDSTAHNKRSAAERFTQAQSEAHNEWCFASLNDVRNNFAKSGAGLDGVHFVVGDVRATLADPANIPEQIAVLRLDTDFYDSTKAEMERLYPRLVSGGSLLIDDFGHWDGARKAIIEYLETIPAGQRPLLNYTDYSGRMGIKP